MALTSSSALQEQALREAWLQARRIQLLKEINVMADIKVPTCPLATSTMNVPPHMASLVSDQEICQAQTSLYRSHALPVPVMPPYAYGARAMPAPPYPIAAMSANIAPTMWQAPKNAHKHAREDEPAEQMPLTKVPKITSTSPTNANAPVPRLPGIPMKGLKSVATSRTESVDSLAPSWLDSEDNIRGFSMDDDEARADALAAALIMNLSPNPSPMPSPMNSRMASVDMSRPLTMWSDRR